MPKEKKHQEIIGTCFPRFFFKARAIRKQARENESLLETAERFYLEVKWFAS